MAKIGCLKPFRGSWSNMKDIVLEDGEIAFITEGSKMIYFGNGTDKVENLTPFADIGGVDISSIGSGSITSAIQTINTTIINSNQFVRCPAGGLKYIDLATDKTIWDSILQISGLPTVYPSFFHCIPGTGYKPKGAPSTLNAWHTCYFVYLSNNVNDKCFAINYETGGNSGHLYVIVRENPEVWAVVC